MDESFDVRVKRLFGSRLFESVPKSSFPASSWSVANGEVERREWNRERGADSDRDDNPCFSTFVEGGFFEKKLKGPRDTKKDQFEDDPDELDDGEDGGSGGGGGGGRTEDGGDDGDMEEWEIRSSIGMDPTLDNEDEEDEYDRTAIGMENAGDRLYMRTVTDHGPRINFHTLVPNLPEDSFEEVHDFHRDPRADHFAADARLKEDKKAAENCRVLQNHDSREPAVHSAVKIAEGDTNLKPILKRKEEQSSSKPKKRVRFDPQCKDVHGEMNEEHEDLYMVPQSMETAAAMEVPLPEESTGVPDYIRNPSKYTRYTFDSSDEVDDTINRQAFAEFHNLVKSSNPNQMQTEIPVDLPKSLKFIPQKKSGDAIAVDGSSGDTQHSSREFDQISARSTGIAARDQESDACDIEEEDVEASTVVASISSRKLGRMYRSKSTSDDST